MIRAARGTIRPLAAGDGRIVSSRASSGSNTSERLSASRMRHTGSTTTPARPSDRMAPSSWYATKKLAS
jgi:hypothetical protein